MDEESLDKDSNFGFSADKMLSLYDMSEEYDEEEDGSFPLQTELTELEFRYDIDHLVNKGGGKQIYRATDLQTGRDIAIAQMYEKDAGEKDKREAFLREARLNAALQHPNIMPVYDMGLDENKVPFFTMRLMSGESLADLLKKGRVHKNSSSLTLNELVNLFLKICEAVAYAHSHKIVHLDLKPENILLGDFGEVVVADWGLAKLIGEPEMPSKNETFTPALLNSITVMGVVKGSPGYMAPEQIEQSIGRKTERTDIFSLGAILYTILTKFPPVKAKSLAEYKTKLLNGIDKPSKRFPALNIHSSLEAICMKGLAINPINRYQSVTQIIDDIQAYQ